MRAQESVTFTSFSTTQGPFFLRGGRYTVAMVVTSGTCSLEILGPDGSTYVIMNDTLGNAVTNASLATYSIQTVDCPPGEYQFAGSSPVAANASVVRVPSE